MVRAMHIKHKGGLKGNERWLSVHSIPLLSILWRVAFKYRSDETVKDGIRTRDEKRQTIRPERDGEGRGGGMEKGLLQC